MDISTYRVVTRSGPYIKHRGVTLPVVRLGAQAVMKQAWVIPPQTVVHENFAFCKRKIEERGAKGALKSSLVMPVNVMHSLNYLLQPNTGLKHWKSLQTSCNHSFPEHRFQTTYLSEASNYLRTAHSLLTQAALGRGCWCTSVLLPPATSYSFSPFCLHGVLEPGALSAPPWEATAPGIT